MNRFMNRKLLV